MRRWGVAAMVVSLGTTLAAAHLPISPSPHLPISSSPHLLTSSSPHLLTSPSPGLRVFLRDGTVLHTHGECATLPEELVCVVLLGGGDGVAPSHDLLTVPLHLVDQERTTSYARTVRAAHYAATRGERDYAELTADITRALDELRASTDRDRRLGIAIVARRRLASWSDDHFGYRAEETRQLVAMIDEVIAELRLAAGDTTFSLDLVANLAPPEPVPILPDPDVSQQLAAALVAARVTPVAAERLALLRSAHRVARSTPGVDTTLAARVAAALDAEEAVDRRYRALMQDAIARADDAVRRGEPAQLVRIIREVEARDRRLGGGRPREMAAFLQRLHREQALAQEQQAILARWSTIKARLLAYEVRVRPVFDAFLAHQPVLDALRDGRTPRPGPLDAAARRFASLEALLESLDPLPEVAAAHGLMQSAVQMARLSLVLGQRLAIAPNADIARNASAAVTGAGLLSAQARTDLIAGLYPRRLR